MTHSTLQLTLTLLFGAGLLAYLVASIELLRLQLHSTRRRLRILERTQTMTTVSEIGRTATSDLPDAVYCEVCGVEVPPVTGAHYCRDGNFTVLPIAVLPDPKLEARVITLEDRARRFLDAKDQKK